MMHAIEIAQTHGQINASSRRNAMIRTSTIAVSLPSSSDGTASEASKRYRDEMTASKALAALTSSSPSMRASMLLGGDMKMNLMSKTQSLPTKRLTTTLGRKSVIGVPLYESENEK